MSDSHKFDWGDVEADLVVPEQPAIACFTNPKGAIVLRQEGQYGTSEDHWVYFQPQHAIAIAYAVLDAAGLTMQIAECLPNGLRDVPRPGTRIKQMEDARPDIDWPAVHKDFDAFESAEKNEDVQGNSKPKDPTGAERQKRYRERTRNARNTEAVTRNAETVTENNELQLVAAE